MYAHIFWDATNKKLAEVPNISHVPRVGENIKLYATKIQVGTVTRVEYTMNNVGADQDVMNDELTVVKIWIE
jgi:hypothetical protein